MCTLYASPRKSAVFIGAEIGEPWPGPPQYPMLWDRASKLPRPCHHAISSKKLSPGQNIALPCRAFRPNYILYLSRGQNIALFYRISVRVHNSRSVRCSPYQGMQGLESKVPHNTLCLCSGAELINCLALLQQYRLWGKTSPPLQGIQTKLHPISV